MLRDPAKSAGTAILSVWNFITQRLPYTTHDNPLNRVRAQLR